MATEENSEAAIADLALVKEEPNDSSTTETSSTTSGTTSTTSTTKSSIVTAVKSEAKESTSEDPDQKSSSSTTPKAEESESKNKKNDESKEEKMKESAKTTSENDEERQRMQVLVSHFTEEQLDRYEMFRRATFPKASVKRVLQTIAGTSVSQNVVISMAGITKVFVGEVIEEALDFKEKLGESGALRPKHIREGARRVRERSQGLAPKTRKRSIIS